MSTRTSSWLKKVFVLELRVVKLPRMRNEILLLLLISFKRADDFRDRALKPGEMMSMVAQVGEVEVAIVGRIAGEIWHGEIWYGETWYGKTWHGRGTHGSAACWRMRPLALFSWAWHFSAGPGTTTGYGFT